MQLFEWVVVALWTIFDLFRWFTVFIYKRRQVVRDDNKSF